MRLTTVAATCALLLPAPLFAQHPDLDHSAKREATASAEGTRLIIVEAHAGSLRVEGKKGLREVRAHGTAWAGSEERLREVELTAEREGSTVRVVVDIPENHDWRDEDRAALDLVVEVPDDIALDVSDGSGEAEIVGVGPLEVSDGSGELRIEDVGGALSVVDGSGELTIRNVGGDVSVRDGSGSIEVSEVRGSVTVEADGSGEINARSVTGKVHVRSDGSGSIEAREVGGDFVVDRKGSGGISYSGVKGEVRVPRNKRS
jgi:hypothetical protein